MLHQRGDEQCGAKPVALEGLTVLAALALRGKSAIEKAIHKPGVTMLTSCLLGSFRTQPETHQEFLSAINLKGGS